jgi:hypothetical protein
MSFFHGVWRERLSDQCVVRNIRGAFITGGVWASEQPSNSPSIPGTLNRFSSATMNQLYHPQRSADFFAFLRNCQIPAFVVANRSVMNFETCDQGTSKLNSSGIEEFLESNDLRGGFLRQVALAHYTSADNSPREPFNYYTAVALTAALSCCPAAQVPWRSGQQLFYSGVYGLALLSASESWEATRSLYASQVDVASKDEDTEMERDRKDSFRRELAAMAKLDVMESLQVSSVGFKALDRSRRFRVELEEKSG